MPPSSGELWGRHFMPTSIIVDCLLPTGIIVPLECSRDAPLRQIKIDLWTKAKQYPLYNLLGEPSSFVFVSITQEAEIEEFYDESKRLCDLHLFKEILRVVEPIGNKDEKIINYDIGIAIGRPIHDFDQMEDLEVQDFRRTIIKVCKEAVERRESNGRESLAGYVFPPDTETRPDLPPILEKKLDRGHLRLSVWIKSASDEKFSYTIRVPKDCTPEGIIGEVILQHLKSLRLTKREQYQKVSEDQKNYLLKVCGSDDYFLGKYPITQYKHIRKCIAKGLLPNLMLLSRDSVLQSLPTTTFHMPSYTRRVPGPENNFNNSVELWSIHTMFKLKVMCATYVHVREVDMIYVKTALYHGPEPLCNSKETNQVIHTDPSWNEWLEFEIYIPDIPRSSRLCVSICSVTKRKKKDEHCMLAWGNMNLFDYKDLLVQGKVDLHLWPVPKMNDELLNPLGITGSNPYNDSPCLQLEFVTYDSSVCFPPMNTIENYTKFITENEKSGFSGSTSLPSTPPPSPDIISQQEISSLQEMAKRDPLSDFTVQEKLFIWQLRNHCSKIPNMLPKLLDAVKWNCRDDVSQLYVLLKEWPQVSFETALELLDCKYADLYVRKYAVRWLDIALSDEKLFEFLLQLVQTLKHESYLDNDLTQMLLTRALLNRKIGHFFFWHLRSELHNPSLSVRFGLVLEAYCRGLGHHLKDLNRQVEALDKLVMLTNALKEKKDEAQKERIKFLCDQVQQQDYVEALQNFVSPLNITHKLGNIVTEKCRIMDSAKRPLWLIWSNPDPMKEMLCNYFEIIFKNGDDLRQDMLTLQVIRIMDNLWRNEGLDLRMMPYICLATGNQVGMIEVVERAKTVYGIQRKAGKLAAIQVDSTQLHKWIKDSTKVNHRYDQAIENFTLSCAGYCVATFILGIGDRNPDNIMVNEDGQIFHIDFGHFLGHFKKKFGINRERVPFVLTEDFLYVFAKGAENPKKSKEFQEFQELCGRAYLVLRKHANLLITLFTMMLSTGIPELQSISDVEYLRKTLAVEKTDEEALQYFQNQFFEAYGGAWTTKLDWFFHSVKHM